MRSFGTVPESPTGTVTFLASDVEASTAVVRKLGAGYADALRLSRDLLRAAFGEHNGYEVDTQGDSFFVAFTRARDAALAAVSAQHMLAAAEQWPEQHRLHVRMGLHTAEPHRWEGGYVGIGVHRASRICAVGHGGQVLLSRSTAGLIDDEDIPGVGLRDLGAHRLKGLDRPERLFQLLVEDLPTEFPPLNTIEAAGLATEMLVILFGDLGSSTPSHETDPAEFRQLIADFHRTVESVLTEHGGVLMASFGDAVGAVFRSARTALATAEALHKRLAAHRWPSGEPLQISLGLAAGEAIATAFGYFGTAVNTSMALCGLAAPGQTLASDAVRVLLDGSDRDRLERSSIGAKAIDNAPPFEVYELVGG
jgi:class 3 adenylate cyclase